MRIRHRLDLLAPEIGGHFETQRGVVGFHLERERHGGGERRFLQRALTERVNRVDRGLVERAQRAAHHFQRVVAIDAALRRQRRFKETLR